MATAEGKSQLVAEPLPAVGAGTKGQAVEPHPAGRVRHGGLIQILRMMAFATWFWLAVFVIATTQYCGIPLYWINLDYYYAYIALTKQSFGLLLITLSQWFAPTTIRISGDRSVRGQLLETKDGRLQTDFPERMVLMANHQLYTDWVYLWWIAYTSRMHGHVYIILKESVKYIPIIGQAIMLYGFILMARNWARDKPRLQHRLQKLNTRHSGPMSGSQSLDPMWLMIFPEGTNLSENTSNQSRKWAEKQGLQNLQHQLLPRSTGLQYCLQELQHTVGWVYDCTVAYEGIPRGKFGQDYFTLRSTFFQGRPPKSVNMYWRRFATSSIPVNDPAKFEVWLRDRWHEKEALMEEYIRNGRFPADEGHDSDGEPADGTTNSSPKMGAGYIETTVRLARWYEVGYIFSVLASLALTANILAKLWNLIFYGSLVDRPRFLKLVSGRAHDPSAGALISDMAPLTNGLINGHGSRLPSDPSSRDARFSDIPSAIDIPVSGMGSEEAVEVSLEELLDDPTELCTLLENENAARNYWMVISLAYAKQKKIDHAIEILNKGLGSLSRGGPKEKLGLLSLMCWLFLWKSREVPRVAPEGQAGSEARTKDYFLQSATGALNEASRINPSFPPLFLARGVLYLLRASLQPPSKPPAPGVPDHSERVETLRQALKCFEDASRVSGGRNMMAVLGRSRAQFSMGKYGEALEGYQEVLLKMPHLQDPDPRIGIGCCLWQLGHRDEARESWERALDINPESKVANILIGIYYIHGSSQYATTDPEFGPIYKKAMTQYTQKAFKLDKEHPLTCATFGNYFLLRKTWATVESLAKKAIELTDVNAIASDGWYLLARREHYQGHPDWSKVNDFYGRADAARGGGDKGFLPARFGTAQVQVILQDIDGAKYRLDKIIQQSRSLEAMMLLGALYAEEAFANQANGLKEDKSQEAKKAIALLEAVRLAWKDPQKKLAPDSSVLVYLARLYELDQPEKSLQCLYQVEQLSLDELPDKEPPEGEEGGEAWEAKLRERLSPQLLNNLGCFQFHAEKIDSAREFFQTALNACVRVGEKNEGLDTDALVTTISYNLARTYEASGLLDEAKQVYEGLLARHADYTDARTRLAYIELRQNPTEDGPKVLQALYETDSTNLEVRALFGWYLCRAKKRTPNIAEDQEQRHYKHTLQHYDKHDRYSLTGMGNLYLTMAREMRRDTDQEKSKRSKTYEKAVEFYDKALQLDAKNAYAAQGIAIALIEDKKDLSSAVQIFSKIRDTVREASVYINLGHVFCELKQYARSIENYEAALTKDRASDPQVLACLGRVWLLRGKQEKSPSFMRTSLDYSHRALAIAPSQVHFQFNIAFVQISLAQLTYTLSESQRTLAEVQAASEGLDEAIDTFTEIAQSQNPPYPKHDIEQRANMGRNTMRRQLERAVQSQREYEEKNAARLQEAREARESEIRRREEQRRATEEAAAEEKRKVAEERQKMLEMSRELAEKRAEEERRREELEYTTDSETGERVKRKKVKKGGKRKKKGDDTDTEGEVDGEDRPRRKNRGRSTEDNSIAGTDGEARAPKKRRKLAKRGGKDTKSDKFKSSELVGDSDSDGAAVTAPAANGINRAATPTDDVDTKMSDVLPSDSEEDAPVAAPTRKKPTNRIASDDEDEDEDGEVAADPAAGVAEEAEQTVPDLDEELDRAREKAKGNAFADGEGAPEPMVKETAGTVGDPDTIIGGGGEV